MNATAGTPVSIKDVRDSFNSLPKDAIKLDFLQRYIGTDEHIYVHPRTGVLSSGLRQTPQQILEYWSSQVFTSVDPEDYDSERPFARARLYYVLLTAFDHLRAAVAGGNSSKLPKLTYCDFATGKGTFLDIFKNVYPECSNLLATEGSGDLCRRLHQRGFKAFNSGLGFGKLGKQLPGGSVDVGFLSWTLCNCIDPLGVLTEIRNSLSDSGLLVISEGSRIMVPFRKSLSLYLSPRLPQDCHPFHFSYLSLSALLVAAGFKLVYENRWRDSDVMLLIASKTDMPDARATVTCDASIAVVEFVEKWHDISVYFDSL